MESMSPQQQVNISHSSSSLTEEAKTCAQMEKRRTKALSCRRQSAPSLVISKALTRSRTISRESCSSPVSPDTCLLVQSYLNPSRMFISHAYAQLKTGLQTQERHLFLFTDILLVSKAKSSTNFKLKALARVCEMWTANCMEEVCEGSTSLDKSFVMGWPTCNCVATFSSVGLKEKWLSLIKSRIIEEKEKDNPKTIPLKVYAKDMGNLSYKTLAVSNSDSANEVIRLALQQFGIVGSAKDFQLWVSSRKDNAPYPLIGHEFPFSIQMSHIREPLDETTIKDDQEVISPEKQMELLLEKLQSDSQCQFILRPSRVAVGHSFVVDPDQKPFKRRRSLINWAFWRGSSNQLDDPPQSPSSNRLFGLPLSMVCTDNSLPQPILDMLVFLFQEGPFTRGIFRRSAGAKACRELRDKLDSGIQVIPMSRQSIFVIAAVFKDFLRSIPGSLLLSDLYEKWMAIVDLSDEADDNQLKAIQGLSDSLPPENILLLKYILAVLYKIQLHAQDNQMNAFNLAICIAPSMLSSPTPSNPEMEGEGTKKVCDLARIMIENCMAIMGDVTALFDGFPQRCSTECHGSDVSSYQMTDSSYDSLENELNDDSGSPFQPMQRKRGKPDSRSCDSVLTLSDCDLDQTDTDPENTLKTHLLLPRLTHPIKLTPAVSLSSPQEHSCEVPTIPKGVRQLRRSSEPAIWNSATSLSKYLESRGNRKGSYDCVTHPGRCDVDEMFVKHLNSLKIEKHLCTKDQSEKLIIRQFKPPPLRLDSSCINLCSPAASPTHSSVSSLDSSFSQHSVDFAKPCPQQVGSFKASVKSSPRSPGAIIPSPRESPPKEKFDWGQLRSSHGLHPNTWLKREHRLSLSKDRCDLDDKDIGEPLTNAEISTKKGHSKDSRAQEPGIPSARNRSTSPTCSEENLLETQHCSNLTVKELRELHNQAYSQHDTGLGRRYIGRSTHGTSGGDSSSLPKSVFYGQNVRSLVLCRKKSHSLTPDEEKSSGRLSFKRRASEPEETCLGLDKDSVKKLERIHRQAIGRQGRFNVTEVEQHDKMCNPRVLLSPAATKTVKDYFFQQGDEDSQSSLKKSQEVALAIVHGKREWMRRCSDTQLEDLEKLVFAEESYV